MIIVQPRDISNSAGLGLFDSGLDVTGWGLPEWLTLALGAYAVYFGRQILEMGTRAGARKASDAGHSIKTKARKTFGTRTIVYKSKRPTLPPIKAPSRKKWAAGAWRSLDYEE